MRVDLHELQKATRTSKLWAKKLDSLTLGTNLQPTKKTKKPKEIYWQRGLLHRRCHNFAIPYINSSPSITNSSIGIIAGRS